MIFLAIFWKLSIVCWNYRNKELECSLFFLLFCKRLFDIMKLEMELHMELPREFGLYKNYLLFGDWGSFFGIFNKPIWYNGIGYIYDTCICYKLCSFQEHRVVICPYNWIFQKKGNIWRTQVFHVLPFFRHFDSRAYAKTNHAQTGKKEKSWEENWRNTC